MFNLFLNFLRLKYSIFLIFSLLIVVFFEFMSYGLAYPIISIFLDLDQTFILKINSYIKTETSFEFQFDETLLVTLLIIVLICQSISFILFRYITLKITLNYLYKLRSNIFHRFFESIYNPNIKISEILNSLTIQSMNAFIFWNSYIDCLKRLLLIISIIVLFFLISLKVLLISIFSLGILFVLINKISYLSKKYGRNMTYIDQKYLNNTSQSLKNYRYIKIANIKDRLFSSINANIKEFNLNQFKFTMLSKLIKESSEPIAIIIIIFIGYISSYYLNIGISLLIISVLLLRRLIANISSLFNSYQALLKNRESIIYIKKMIDNMKVEKKDFDIKKFEFNTISLSNIYYNYTKKNQIFVNLNLQIKKNKSVVIYGKSGSGKSTLINLITGISLPSKGKVFYNDIESKNLEIQKNLKIGIVSQDEVIFNMSLLDNLKLRNPNAKKSKINELISALGLKSIFENKIIDLSININEITSNLSGGEKQRIALIREVLNEPDILILDEPTSSLDKTSLNKTIELLNKIRKTTTLIIFTHQNDFKKYNYDIYELKNKKLNQIK